MVTYFDIYILTKSLATTIIRHKSININARGDLNMKASCGSKLKKAFIAALAGASLGGCAVTTSAPGYGGYGYGTRTTVAVDPAAAVIGAAVITGAVIANSHGHVYHAPPPRVIYRMPPPAPYYGPAHRGYRPHHRHW
jgi:hypothetical protein